jgi:hypothetical protein
MALLTLCFVAHASVFVRRLTNSHFGDIEFTGWSGPIGSRLLSGERPYLDFVLPIPPGSFLVLAAIQKLAGRALLLQELWLNAFCQLAMAWLSYAVALRLTTRLNAVLVAVTTTVALGWLNKECAYDHTAQLVAWSSFWSGVCALTEKGPARRARLWALTGFLAAFTLFFKQSTGSGALLGWSGALAYLTLVDAFSGVELGARRRDVRAALIGALAGLGALVVLLALLGSGPVPYFQSVFVDGPKLKGGSLLLVKNVLGYVTLRDAWLSSVGATLVVVIVGARIVRGQGSLHVGDELRRDEPLTSRAAALLALALFATFGGALALLLSRYSGLRPGVVSALDRLKIVPHFGFVFLAAFFLAHLGYPRKAPTEAAPEALAGGHVLNALVLAALGVSLLHNTSAPEFRAFYDNNPIIPFALLALFVALDRARLTFLKILVVAAMLATCFGNRLDRALLARFSVGQTGYWAGMKVSERGRDLVRAAARVRELTSPTDQVLVLPEDVALAALIGRPRPGVRGAIVFVDQYPERLVAEDIPLLAREPPKVILLHPAESHLWAQLFRIWSGDSGAQKLVDFTQQKLLPERYTRDSVVKTRWLFREATLEIWIRRD